MNRWLDDVSITLYELGGRATISEITDRIVRMRNLENNEHPEESVRATLNSNPGIYISYERGIWEFEDKTLHRKI